MDFFLVAPLILVVVAKRSSFGKRGHNRSRLKVVVVIVMVVVVVGDVLLSKIVCSQLASSKQLSIRNTNVTTCRLGIEFDYDKFSFASTMCRNYLPN